MKSLHFWLFLLANAVLVCFLSQTVIAQGTASVSKKVDSLRFVTEMPSICEGTPGTANVLTQGCGSKHFWEVVKLKANAIPLLLDKLDDSTSTAAAVSMFGHQYTVADIAYVALGEIFMAYQPLNY